MCSNSEWAWFNTSQTVAAILHFWIVSFTEESYFLKKILDNGLIIWVLWIVMYKLTVCHRSWLSSERVLHPSAPFRQQHRWSFLHPPGQTDSEGWAVKACPTIQNSLGQTADESSRVGEDKKHFVIRFGWWTADLMTGTLPVGNRTWMVHLYHPHCREDHQQQIPGSASSPGCSGFWESL